MTAEENNMDKFEFKRFVPFSKVDDEERMVYGFASTPDVDSDGEIITVQALKNALPAYLQYPALREMHQAKAAGTVKNTDIDGNNGLYIGAKVVDNDAWSKVKEGVYRGFSVGGHVLDRKENVINAIDLVEISLVDVPANKSARIEVWKKEKITKDAETVWELSNLMIQLKQTISYFEYLKKPTKDLEKALEQIKSVIGQEATETEKESQKKHEERMGEMFMSDNPSDLQKVVASLDRITFDGNPVAEALRKAVKTNMAEKIKKETPVDPKKDEAPVEPVVEPVVEPNKEGDGEPKKDEEPKDPTNVEPVKTEGDEPEGDGEGDDGEGDGASDAEPKETAADVTLAKVNDALGRLEILNKTEKKEKVQTSEAVTKMADALTKVVDAVTKLGDRVAKLEAQPADLKSKATYLIEKDQIVKEEKGKDKPADPSSELGKKQTRLVELNALFEKLGPNEFAKQGYSIEAGKIQREISELKG